MNSLFNRECSSGCESGWTLYFEHEDSFLSPHPNQKSANYFITQDDDEEDLSMVSDASSGPPHFCNNNGFFIHTPDDVTFPKNNGKRKKNNEHRRKRDQEQLSFLDDTASSSIFSISTNNLAHSSVETSTDTMLDFSQGHSSTQFESKSRFQEHYGCGKSRSSGTELQQNQLSDGGMKGREQRRDEDKIHNKAAAAAVKDKDLDPKAQSFSLNFPLQML